MDDKNKSHSNDGRKIEVKFIRLLSLPWCLSPRFMHNYMDMPMMIVIIFISCLVSLVPMWVILFRCVRFFMRHSVIFPFVRSHKIHSSIIVVHVSQRRNEKKKVFNFIFRLFTNANHFPVNQMLNFLWVLGSLYIIFSIILS